MLNIYYKFCTCCINIQVSDRNTRIQHFYPQKESRSPSCSNSKDLFMYSPIYFNKWEKPLKYLCEIANTKTTLLCFSEILLHVQA